MTTWLIVLTNVHWSAVSWDGVHPPTWKGYRNREREAQLFILAQHTITPYLHTFRLCEHLHIQKYSAIFPRLPTVRVCMHNNVLERLCMWQQCIRGGDNSSFVCRVCEHVHYMWNSSLPGKRPMWSCVTTQPYLFLIIVQDWDCGKEKIPTT